MGCRLLCSGGHRDEHSGMQMHARGAGGREGECLRDAVVAVSNDVAVWHQTLARAWIGLVLDAAGVRVIGGMCMHEPHARMHVCRCAIVTLEFRF